MLTVLIAEDEFAILEVLSLALEGEGHNVLRAGDGADALRIVNNHACDVIVCDENMPMMDGHALIEALRAQPRLSSIPVILMADTWGRPLPSINGITVLGKPILLAELSVLVEELGKSRRKA